MSDFSTAFTYRRRITIKKDYVDAALTNFPLKVSFSGDASIGAACRADGYDVIFTSEDGTTALKFEREYFNVSGGLATGVFWVKVPTIAVDGTTAVYMYYGDADATDTADPANVWDSDFKVVYHMKDGADTSHISESTSSALTMTKKGANEPIEATAKVAKGQSFDGSDDKASVNIEVYGYDDFTFEAWVKPDSLPAGWAFAVGSDTGGAAFGLNASGHPRLTKTNTGDCDSADSAIASGGWSHIAVTRDGSEATNNIRYYINGVLDSTKSFYTEFTQFTKYIGVGFDGTDGYFDGIIDEVRISEAIRPAAWIKFEYRNVAEPDGCLSWGPERPVFAFGNQGVEGETHQGAARAHIRRRG